MSIYTAAIDCFDEGGKIKSVRIERDYTDDRTALRELEKTAEKDLLPSHKRVTGTVTDSSGRQVGSFNLMPGPYANSSERGGQYP